MAEIMGMTGFQSPCAEYAEDSLSLDQLLVTNKPATFYIYAGGTSKLLNINLGDLLIIDRSLKPTEDDVVLAEYAGNFIITKFKRVNGQIQLHPWKKIVEDPDDFKIEGVVKSVTHRYRK
ncbi:MAG: LexA family protein [Bacteriovoracaceae bacterium]